MTLIALSHTPLNLMKPHVANSFERLYDGLWARREAGHNGESSTRTGNSAPSASPRREAGHVNSNSASAKAGSKAHSTSPARGDGGKSAKAGKLRGGTVLRGTNRGSRWSVSGEVTHLQRRVADLAAELQVQSAAHAMRVSVMLSAVSAMARLSQWSPQWRAFCFVYAWRCSNCTHLCSSAVTKLIKCLVHGMVKLLKEAYLSAECSGFSFSCRTSRR